MIKPLALCLAACLATPAAAAAATVWVCEMAPTTNRSFIFQTYVINHDPDPAKTMVFDPLIKYAKGVPIPVSSVAETGKALTFKWKVTGAPSNRSRKAQVAFMGVLNPATGKFNVTATPLGADNQYRNHGTCRKRA